MSMLEEKACGACSEVDPAPEILCSVCKRDFHRSCVPERLLRGTTETVCGLCAALEPPVVPFAPPVGHSTIVTGTIPRTSARMSNQDAVSKVLELEERLKVQADMFSELMAMMREMRAAHPAVLSDPPAPAEPVAAHTSSVRDTPANDNSSVNNGSRNRSLDASLWRTRLPTEFVARALQASPLTKEQLTRRKQGTDLPLFNGDPLEWLTFIRRYLETAGEMCGFTCTEDMKRIRCALSGPALALVEPYMSNPDNLDSVISALQQNFGQRYMLLEAVAKRIRKLPNLAEDLSNVGKFAGEVDQMRIVSNMDPTQPIPSHCIAEIESKLPDRHADKWLDVRGIHNSPDIDALADFIMDLHTRQIALRRCTTGKARTTGFAYR